MPTTVSPTQTKYSPKVRILTTLIATLSRTVRRTCRCEYRGATDWIYGNPDGSPCIFSCWHNRLLFLPACVPLEARRNVKVLTSRSRDGAYAAAYVEAFGATAIRGSSSRGGTVALRRLIQTVEGGISVFITPDGPRGPRYSIQPGAVLLASKTGAPIVPVAVNCRRRWELHSWDRTQIPKPFSRLFLHIGRPLYVPDSLHSTARKGYREQLAQAMEAITDDAT